MAGQTTHLSPLGAPCILGRRMGDAEVIISGAGPVGLCLAMLLAEQQIPVTVVEAIGERIGVPLITAGLAVVTALNTIGARHIGLVSPYPESLTRVSIDYWQEHGFKIDAIVHIPTQSDQFHPIYSIRANNALQALDKVSATRLDAILMLGTGMPTLGPILDRSRCGGTPVMSCMTCLAWSSIDAARGRKPDPKALIDFMRGEGWDEEFRRRTSK